MNEADAFAIVREHRWVSADEQAEHLRATNPKVVYSLGGGKKLPTCSLHDLVKMSTGGRVFRLYHPFLLVEPAKHTRTMRLRFRALLHEIVDKRGAVIEDVYANLTTAHPGQRKAMEAMAKEMIARSCQGARSAANGERGRGRPLVEFTPAQLKEAKAIWRNVKDYPRWGDAQKAMPEGFTTARAYKLWQGRR